MLFQFLNCRPLRASWQPVYDVRCWPRHYVREFGWASSGMFNGSIVCTRITEAGILTAMDFILAFMPIHLIRTLNRSTRERVLICFMMSLGIMAGVISSYKISISDKTFAGDLLSGTVLLAMWNELEALLGIVAACIPCLKAPGEQLLHHFGLLSSRMEIPRPSFVLSLQDRPSPQSSSGSSRLLFVPSSEGSGKGTNAEKVAVSTLEVDYSVP
jgi:hypothetical protein